VVALLLPLPVDRLGAVDVELCDVAAPPSSSEPLSSELVDVEGVVEVDALAVPAVVPPWAAVVVLLCAVIAPTPKTAAIPSDAATDDPTRVRRRPETRRRARSRSAARSGAIWLFIVVLYPLVVPPE
jgi:hypothetical protein